MQATVHCFTSRVPGQCVNCGQGFTLLSAHCQAAPGQYERLINLPPEEHGSACAPERRHAFTLASNGQCTGCGQRMTGSLPQECPGKPTSVDSAALCPGCQHEAHQADTCRAQHRSGGFMGILQWCGCRVASA